ncbi:MAG TPA: hypothetical protein PKD12_03765 [Nitrospira sp.]|nr:hypothetical protein [Nitrospira sp.]
MIRNQYDVPSEEVEEELAGYSCPICAETSYHLVLRVEAISHHAALVVECDTCRYRQVVGCK